MGQGQERVQTKRSSFWRAMTAFGNDTNKDSETLVQNQTPHFSCLTCLSPNIPLSFFGKAILPNNNNKTSKKSKLGDGCARCGDVAGGGGVCIGHQPWWRGALCVPVHQYPQDKDIKGLQHLRDPGPHYRLRPQNMLLVRHSNQIMFFVCLFLNFVSVASFDCVHTCASHPPSLDSYQIFGDRFVVVKVWAPV